VLTVGSTLALQNSLKNTGKNINLFFYR
jgi:hypothetical protein